MGAFTDGRAPSAHLRGSGLSPSDMSDELENLNRAFGVHLGLSAANPIGQPMLRHESHVADVLSIGIVRGTALHSTNEPPAEKPSQRRYIFYFCEQRHGLALDDGRLLQVRPRELMCITSDAPWQLRFPRRYSLITLGVPREWLHDSAPRLRGLRPGQLDLSIEIRQLLCRLIQTTQSMAHSGQLGTIAHEAGNALSSLLSLGIASASANLRHQGSASRGEDRRLQIRKYIDANLDSPHLSVASVASHFGVTPRYVHMVFSADGIAPAEYLRRQRLQRSAELLRDPQWDARSITDVAFASGFSSSSHFSTQFKRAFDLSPREFRRMASDNPDTDA